MWCRHYYDCYDHWMVKAIKTANAIYHTFGCDLLKSSIKICYLCTHHNIFFNVYCSDIKMRKWDKKHIFLHGGRKKAINPQIINQFYFRLKMLSLFVYTFIMLASNIGQSVLQLILIQFNTSKIIQEEQEDVEEVITEMW